MTKLRLRVFQDMQKQGSLWLLLALAVPLGCLSVVTAEVEPVVLIYGVDLPQWRTQIATLLEQDPRVDEKVITINSTDCLAVALLYPNVKTAILMGQNAAVILGAERQILSYFEEGGGLVGFHDLGNALVSGALATRVFPLYANVSTLGRMTEGYLVQTLVRDQINEINEYLPQELVVKDAEINLALDKKTRRWANATPASGEYWALYRDTVYGAPTVVAYRNEGCSVTFAGGDIDDSPANKLKYFGNLFFDDTFAALLLNAVAWVKEHEMRTDLLVQETLDSLKAARDGDTIVRDEAEKAQHSRRMLNLLARVLMNLGGVVAILVTYLKFIKS